MSTDTLYMTYRSPYARKIRIAFLEKNIPFTEISIDLENKSAAFLQVSAGSSVPTLQTPEGLVLDDSTLILQYLEEAHREVSLSPKTRNERYEAWNWEELADRMCDLNVRVYKESFKGGSAAEVLEKTKSLTQSVMTRVSERLKGRDYIMGEFSVADIALACAMNWMSFRLKTDWAVYGQRVVTWLERVNTRESFKKTIPRV